MTCSSCLRCSQYVMRTPFVNSRSNFCATAYFHMFGNVDWSRDVIIQDGAVDALDHGSHNFAFGGRIGIDATRKLPGDGYTRGWPIPIEMSDEIKERVTRRWKAYGVR